MKGVVAFGSHQYNFAVGEAFDCQKLDLDQSFSLNNAILLYDEENNILENSSSYKINYEILDTYRDDKILIIKKKRRKDYRKTRGHRQYLSRILVKSVEKVNNSN